MDQVTYILLSVLIVLVIIAFARLIHLLNGEIKRKECFYYYIIKHLEKSELMMVKFRSRVEVVTYIKNFRKVSVLYAY